MMVKEFSQESIADTAEVKSVPDKGWAALVIFMAFIIYAVAVAYGVSFGTIFSGYLIETRTSPTKVSWIYNMFHVFSSLGSIMGATLAEEFGWRKVLFTSGLLCSLGLALSAFTPSADFLFFSYSVLAGCVQRILAFTAVHAAVSYCPNYQGFVNGIVSSGSGIGLLMSAPFIAYLTEIYSFRGAALIFSGVCLNSCVAGMVFHPLKWHMDFPYVQFGGTSDNKKAFSSSKIVNGCSLICSLLKRMGDTIRLFKSPHAVILGFIVCFNLGIFLNVWTFVPFVMKYDGYTVDEVSFFMSVAAGCNLGSRLVLMFMSLCVKDKSTILYILGSILSFGTLIAFGIRGNVYWKMTNLALCSFGFGITFSLNTMVIIEIMGAEMLLPVLGVCGLINAMWHLIIGPVIGVVIDVYESYNAGLFFLAGLLFISTIIWVLLPVADAFYQRRPDHTRHKDHQLHPNSEHSQQQQQQERVPQPLNESVSLFHQAAARSTGYASVVP